MLILLYFDKRCLDDGRLDATPVSGGPEPVSESEWIAANLTDVVLDDQSRGVQLASEWSSKLSARVAYLDDHDGRGFHFEMFDAGAVVRAMLYDPEQCRWTKIQGEPLPWEAACLDAESWDNIEDFEDGTPEQQAAASGRLVEGSTLPYPGYGFRKQWWTGSTMPDIETHRVRADFTRSTAHSEGSGCLMTSAIAVGVLLGVAGIGALLGLLLHACGLT